MTEYTGPRDDKTERIVVGVDGSDASRAALSWAARQAKLTGARLEVVTCWTYPTSYGWSLPFPEGMDFESDAQSILTKCLHDVVGEDSGIDLSTLVAEGHAALVLMNHAKDASLMVIGSRGHGEFAGMLLGSVSEYLATHAPCPTVIIRGKVSHH